MTYRRRRMNTRNHWRLTIAVVTLLSSVVACGPSLYIKGETAISAATPDVPPPAACPTAPPLKAEPPKRVEVKDKSIVISEKIQFELNKAIIKTASHALLDEIVGVLKDNPRIKKIAVEGHASADGDAAANKKLSDERAKSVVAYIVGKGIAASRLEAKGWGEEKPIADNKTEEGRDKNRRVEFNIIAQDAPGSKPPPSVAPPLPPATTGPPKPPTPPSTQTKPGTNPVPRKAGKK